MSFIEFLYGIAFVLGGTGRASVASGFIAILEAVGLFSVVGGFLSNAVKGKHLAIGLFATFILAMLAIWATYDNSYTKNEFVFLASKGAINECVTQSINMKISTSSKEISRAILIDEILKCRNINKEGSKYES